MKGFASTHIVFSTVREKIRYKEALKNAGFKTERSHNVYVKTGYGALVRNIDARIQSLEDILTYKDELLGINPYEDIVQMIKTGKYVFKFGPAVPNRYGKIDNSYVGLYCKNFLNIVHYEREGTLIIN